MNYIVEKIRSLTSTLLFAWFYPKRKIKKDDFKKLIAGSQCAGALEVCDFLVYLHAKEEFKSIDEFVGEVHNIRFEVWKEYCTYSDRVRKMKDVTDVMQVEIDIDKFVSDPDLAKKLRK